MMTKALLQKKGACHATYYKIKRIRLLPKKNTLNHWVLNLLKIIIFLIDQYEISIEDVKPFTKHIYKKQNALPHKTGTLFITGGGAYHNFFN
jgi:hypothetical protein